jgi:glucokinase
VLNGTLVSGTNCGAGEVGMLPYKGSILEHYCSGQFFERFFGETGDSVYKKAQNGDAEAIAKYTDYAHHISKVLRPYYMPTTLKSYCLAELLQVCGLI